MTRPGGIVAITGVPVEDLPRLPQVEAVRSVGGPVWVAWRESALTRAYELETLVDYLAPGNPRDMGGALSTAIRSHLQAVRDAADGNRVWVWRHGPLLERSMSNLDAAEAQLLNLAPSEYLAGQMPSLLRHVQRHLRSGDPGRVELERVVKSLAGLDRETQNDIVARERDKIVATVRAASSEALRENLRLRSFRNIVVSTTVLLSLLAVALGIFGFHQPTLLPLCFAPADANQITVVCPTNQSPPITPQRAGVPPAQHARDIDSVVADTATRMDVIVIELVGLLAAAIASAAMISHVRGSSERYGIPVALAALKLPTGALTAVLGLLLMRGQFIPGLNALDNPGQIVAWGLVFGYAQQLFTRLIDQQGQTVLNSVRSADTQPNVQPPERKPSGR
ncbi:hypothetical protein [Mycolicibacterium goodii]|uniref:hypothetical protein n=1 Tax=Mycolicibacterium goodii TaxID=134601 RepID=UPI001F047483|nr:hypothetical protein [Mycolicibacterium goodii]ULN48981.1 hypothetical protein MI170_06305 [Mycolicibacterium goodii]